MKPASYRQTAEQRQTVGAPLLPLALGAIFLLSIALVPLAAASLVLHAHSAAQTALHAAFILMVSEKLVSMFGRMRGGRVPPPLRDASMALVGIAFTAMFHAVLFGLWRGGSATAGPAARGVGLVLYAAALGLHYWASRHLAHAMTAPPTQRAAYGLVVTGPYAVVRHPIYLAACMEALAIPLIFLSAWGLAISVLAFIPLEVYRSIREDRHAREQFGEPYQTYASAVPALWPAPPRRHRRTAPKR